MTVITYLPSSRIPRTMTVATHFGSETFLSLLYHVTAIIANNIFNTHLFLG